MSIWPAKFKPGQAVGARHAVLRLGRALIYPVCALPDVRLGLIRRAELNQFFGFAWLAVVSVSMKATRSCRSWSVNWIGCISGERLGRLRPPVS